MRRIRYSVAMSLDGQLTSHRIYEKSGTVLLTYAVSR